MCRLNKKLIKNRKLDKITKSKIKDEINTKLVEKVENPNVENSDKDHERVNERDDKVVTGHENKEVLSVHESRDKELLSGYGYVCRSIQFMMIRNYMILRLINEGSSGKVYLALDDKRKFFALKFINKTLDFHTYTKIRDELEISYSVKHENIVETNVILETRRSLVFVMEYCSGGDLITFIRRNGSISEERARNGFKMILNAIKYLHSHNIYHRDIKPENLLIQSNKLKLCDFGASIRIRSDVRLFETVGTMSYAAPEVLDGTCGYYGEKADVWSLGVVLYAMVFGQLPYTTKEDNVKSVLNKILTTKLTFPSRKSIEIVKLIKQMLQIEPSKRISIQHITTHPWIINNEENKNIEITSNINTINSNNVNGEILSIVMDNII
uniref:Serine/threonine protein kinase, putative n=1 Tax=Theileria annulata TaxID=5874 RepID=A0A3B0NFW9_THEAN